MLNIAELRKVEKEHSDICDLGVSPLPWTADEKNKVWAGDGDGIVHFTSRDAASGYFPPPTAALIVAAVNALPQLLDIAEAGEKLREALKLCMWGLDVMIADTGSKNLIACYERGQEALAEWERVTK